MTLTTPGPVTEQEQESVLVSEEFSESDPWEG